MSQNKLPLLAVLVACAAAFAAPAALAQKKPVKQAPTQESAPAVPGSVTEVSDYEYNTFVFPSPVKRVFFPAAAPVSGKPKYLADNTQVLIQFDKSERPIQMVAELEDNSVVTLRVQPRSVYGVVYTVNGARQRSLPAPSRSAEAAAGGSPRGEDIELLKHLMTHQAPPSGFDPVELPSPVRFDKFAVVPLASWSDSVSKRIIVFSLVSAAGQTAVVAPPQFYRPGITAVLLDGDVVDEATSPQLFVVEELTNE